MDPAKIKALLEGPASPSPPGLGHNYVNPPNFGHAMLVVQTIFLVIPTLCVFIRVYTKLRINRKCSLEDYLCVLAWAIYIGLYVPSRLASEVGCRHQWDVQLKNLKLFLYQIHIGYILYGCVVFTIKASILIQYIRIFSSVEKHVFYWTCHALIWINFVFYSACFFLETFSCKPIAKAWDPLIKTGSCLDVQKVNIAAAAMNVVSDFVILLLPQPIIWRLNMGFKQRLGVSSIFAVALLACISAAVRLYYCVRLAHSKDLTYDASMMAVYIFPELGIGIIISCLPTVPKFFRTLSETKTFSRFGTSIFSLLGLTKGRTGGSHSREISKPSGRHVEKSTLGTFDRLVEEHELRSNFKKIVAKEARDTTREEGEFGSSAELVASKGSILRTVHVETTSEVIGGTGIGIPRATKASDPAATLWQGNHNYKAAVSHPST